MTLINDTKEMAENLFRNGSTSNEQLQLLLWHLKEITELSDEELAMPKNGFPGFFTGYLTELANRYRPTNTSDFPHKLLTLHSSFNEMRVNIHTQIDDFIMKTKVYDLDESSRIKLLNDCFDEIKKITMNISTKVQSDIDECLRDIKY